MRTWRTCALIYYPENALRRGDFVSALVINTPKNTHYDSILEALKPRSRNEQREQRVGLTLLDAGAVDLGINALLGATTRIASEAAGVTNVARKGKRTEEALAAAAKTEKTGAKAAAKSLATKPKLSSRAARREAMRRADIPTSQQPVSQRRTRAGSDRPYYRPDN